MRVKLPGVSGDVEQIMSAEWAAPASIDDKTKVATKVLIETLFLYVSSVRKSMYSDGPDVEVRFGAKRFALNRRRESVLRLSRKLQNLSKSKSESRKRRRRNHYSSPAKRDQNRFLPGGGRPARA